MDKSFEEVKNKVQTRIAKELARYPEESADGQFTNYEIMHTFPESVIVERFTDQGVQGYLEIPYAVGEDEDHQVFIGEPMPVERDYVVKGLSEAEINYVEKDGKITVKEEDGCELTGPIVMKNEDKRLAYSAVLVPGEPDHDYDKGEKILSKEEIERVAHDWMENYRNIDLRHTLNNVAVPVESYIAPKDIDTAHGVLPKGTWILGSRVEDENSWQAVKEGRLTGYSVMGIRKSTLESVMKDNGEVALKKTLIKDLGEDWVACAVSIVDEPAVPKAKFFSIKSRENDGPKEKPKTIYQKVTDMFSSQKAGRSISETNYNKLVNAFENLKQVLDLAEDERKRTDSDSQQTGEKNREEEVELTKEEFQELLQEQMGPIAEEVEALKAKVAEKEEAESEEVKQENEELEAFKSQMVEKLEELESKISKKNTITKGLKGQDGESEEESRQALKGRDVFGRRVDK